MTPPPFTFWTMKVTVDQQSNNLRFPVTGCYLFLVLVLVMVLVLV